MRAFLLGRYVYFLIIFLIRLEALENASKKKPVMGSIPMATLPYTDIPRLMEIYLDNGIYAFCLDFEGRVPFSVFQKIVQIHNILKERKVDAFIYAENVNIGKPSKKSSFITAKDVLSFAFVLDSISDNHLVGGGRSENVENLRLFSRKYAYWKVTPQEMANFCRKMP